ncbi:MAG: hypothetical protein OEM52_09415, partial [bacterium]|nr:hypothetical protein [bacterium]
MSETTQKADNEKYCSECGNIINVKAEICPKCGVRQFTPSNNFSRISPNGKSQLAGGLFAI